MALRAVGAGRARGTWLQRKIDITRLIVRSKILPKFLELFVFDRSARLSHEIEIEIEIVQRDQPQPENFLRFHEMTDVSARKLTTG